MPTLQNIIGQQLGVATATSVQFNPTTSGIIGVADASNASTGIVGEFITSQVLSTSPVSMPAFTVKNITSISLTAGDWDVWGNIAFITTGQISQYSGWTSNVSATVPNLSYQVILHLPGSHLEIPLALQCLIDDIIYLLQQLYIYQA